MKSGEHFLARIAVTIALEQLGDAMAQIRNRHLHGSFKLDALPLWELEQAGMILVFEVIDVTKIFQIGVLGADGFEDMLQGRHTSQAESPEKQRS